KVASKFTGPVADNEHDHVNVNVNVNVDLGRSHMQSSLRPLQFSSTSLPQISWALGEMAGSWSLQSRHHENPSPSPSLAPWPCQQASQLCTKVFRSEK